MILDCNGIATQAKLKFDTLQDLSDREAMVHAHNNQQENQSFLIFNNHHDENFALPLSFITRIEKVHIDRIEQMGEEEFVQIGSKNVPLFRLEKKIKCKPIQLGEDGYMYLLVPHMVRSPYAIVASRVQDVVNTNVDIQTDVMRVEGVLGSAIIKERMTLVLDVYGLFNERRGKGMIREGLENRHILLAEDTPFFRTMIQTYLVEEGFNVICAKNGLEAMDILEERSADIDMVLSDIEMPAMDGIELVNKIKIHPDYKHLPVMAITAIDDPETMSRGREAGFDAYQLKLDKLQLIKTVVELLAYSKQPT
jgi:two-component system chemotaxis sensor kinase CheA